MQHRIRTRDVELPSGTLAMRGILQVPDGSAGVVLFAHGSGSGRLSPRNGYVARVLQENGLATLLMDLLTVEEERADARTGHLRFDIDLLAGRLLDATAWVAEEPELARLPVSYFGASTGAAAALQAAARRRGDIRAVVSRGGRPDLANAWLPQVEAPTLLIVGGDDLPVIPLNRQAYAALRCERELAIVPGASHLFEEPGSLEEVAGLAAEWIARHTAVLTNRSSP
ncbi:MAG: alpha/beta hydrolase [Gemmatimonadota bacterium]|nr:alpha/beta hydrolase [Gemmatimonadota bacterium]